MSGLRAAPGLRPLPCLAAAAVLLAAPGWAANSKPAATRQLDNQTEIPAGNLHEECFDLRRGQRVRFDFRAAQPLDFNIQARDGDTLVHPVRRNGVRALKSTYTPGIARNYCLVWNNRGARTVALHYRIGVEKK
jgi:hypothetical protein